MIILNNKEGDYCRPSPLGSDSDTRTLFSEWKLPRHIGAALLALLLLLVGGCYTRSVGVCPSTIPLTASDTYTKIGYTSGDSTTVVVLGIPFGPSNPSRVARDEAMAEKNANALIQVTEDFTVVNLLLIQFYTTTVEATAIQFARHGMEVE